jgi:DNA-binding NtrC family response regulator
MQILVVGALGGQIGAATRMAMQRGADVLHAENIANAMGQLRSGVSVDLILIDVQLDVAQCVVALTQERMTIPVVACGVETDAKAAVTAIRAGAKEYIPLPPDQDLIAAVLAAVVHNSQAFLSEDAAMGQVLRMADQVAPSEASILITGESGTGKEVMARYVHGKSKRAAGKFVAVNCAAIPENLLESELFGHEKGAFTGAIARRIGKFEDANGGTLLLDEISEMDVRLQAKLLRAIQEKEIDRLGGNKPVKVDVRLLATSNRNLQAQVQQGLFREDLYFRLNVMTLALPPLRQRPADIVMLATHFIEKYSAMNGVPVRPLAADAVACLQAHRWPGNVRELENTMHRAVLLATGAEIGRDAIMITAPIAAEAAEDGSESTMVGRTVADVERELIIDTLKHCLGNRTHAANILGISIRTLRNKLKQYSEDGQDIPQPGLSS